MSNKQNAVFGVIRRLIIGIVMCFIAVQIPVEDTCTAQELTSRDRQHRQFLERRQQIFDRLQQDLRSVVNWCESHDLPEAAAIVMNLAADLNSPDADSEPPRSAAPEVDKSLPIEEQTWQLQLRHHRELRANELYMLARSALRNGFPALAFSLVSDVLLIDPDHKNSRLVLGQEFFSDPEKKQIQGYTGEWVSLFEKKMRTGSRAQTLHPRFGWIPVSSVSRYEAGQRPWKGSWITAEKEAELRRNFQNAWEVPSEHFLVRTNVSLEEGIRLSQNLEVFYGWMHRNFAAFFETPQALQDRFEKASQSSRSVTVPQMEVHYFATRAEYQKRIEGKVPPNIETNGLYWEADRTSYFYIREQDHGASPLFHEATHQILDVHTIDARRTAARRKAQLLREKRPVPWVLAENSNFWVIEGLACYFESFEIIDGKVTMGRPDFVRFERARQRVLEPTQYFYLPARQFFSMGKDAFQRHPQVSQLYTQAAGFAHFLMEYEDGLYRDDLITLLAALYQPDPKTPLDDPSFFRISGVSPEELDQQYRTHMQNLEDMQRRESAIPAGTSSEFFRQP